MVSRIVWSSTKIPQATPFSPQMIPTLQKGQSYQDLGCDEKGCSFTRPNELGRYFSTFAKKHDQLFFLVRDFSYLNALKEKNVLEARESLEEIDSFVGGMVQLSKSREDILVLVTGVESLDYDFPAQGKEWMDFDKNGLHARPRAPSLASPVFASGPRAENFCGMYESSQIFERILSSPKQQGLEFKLINPFN
jgi:hypothetical protein